MVRAAWHDSARLWTPFHLSQPNVHCGEFDKAEIGFSELVVTGCNAAELFELAEEAFDAVACGVEGRVIAMLMPTGAAGWDHRAPALVKDEVVEPIGIVGAIGEDRAGMDAVDESGGRGHVVLLTGAQAEANGQPQRVGHGMEFCAKTPT